MSFVPRFKLYNSTGLSLLYTFPVVQESNHPHTSSKSVEIESQRGKGSILIDGGAESWDLRFTGILSGEDYQALVTKMDELESAVDLNIPYIMKIDKTATTVYEYKVKRILPIEWGDTNFRNNFIEYRITLRVNCW
ncbi:MAG: hypothetical protein JW924_03280 [Fusobacteriaceae bacterium]|nr:hypothetical protein [Fusobacteriaceae bacterium]